MTWPLADASSATASGFYDAGIGRFLISPGFGGLAALTAALLAFMVARRNAAQEREAARQERWWASLTWVYDRATTEREEARLPGAVALTMMARLFDEAHTDLEVQGAGSIVALFTDETGET